MPRPKVKPQDRQRSARACDACKASKKRCDANEPCRLCLKKGTQDTCTYTPTARDRSSRRSEAKSSRANSIAVATNVSSADFRPVITTPSQRPRAQFGDQPLASQDAEGDEVVDEDADSETDYVPDSRNSVERTSQQRPLMLSSSSGDKGIKQSLDLKFIHTLLPLIALPTIKWPCHNKNPKLTFLAKLVFVGNTAALSFLRFLQKTLKHYVGPSGFTDRQHSHNWFEMAGSDVDGGTFYDGLGETEKNDLIHCFLDAVGLMPMYSIA